MSDLVGNPEDRFSHNEAPMTSGMTLKLLLARVVFSMPLVASVGAVNGQNFYQRTKRCKISSDRFERGSDKRVFRAF